MSSNNQFNKPTTHNESIKESQSRLLARRKTYSQARVPTISLDYRENPSLSVQGYRNGGAESTSQMEREQTNTSSFLNPTQFSGSEGSSSLSIHPSERLNFGFVQRALSASPTANSPSEPRETSMQHMLSASSLDGVSMRSSVHPSSALRVPMLYQRSLTKPFPYSPPMDKIDHTAPLMGQWLNTTDPKCSVGSATCLTQQRSLESHESSVSMPSACSSGSGSVLWCRKGLSKISAKKQQPPQSEDERAFMNEEITTHRGDQPTHRRSSYEMATGKLKIPEPKVKKSPLQNALHVLKDKRNILFRRKCKTTDETAEPSDPVYHLLRCAATPDHQPSTCMCVCHTNECENAAATPEMNCPINVLIASRNQTGRHPLYKHKVLNSRLPTSMPTLCQSEDDVYLSEQFSQLNMNSPKKPTLPLSSALTRRRLFSGYRKYHSQLPKESAIRSNLKTVPNNAFSETTARSRTKR